MEIMLLKVLGFMLPLPPHKDKNKEKKILCVRWKNLLFLNLMGHGIKCDRATESRQCYVMGTENEWNIVNGSECINTCLIRPFICIYQTPCKV